MANNQKFYHTYDKATKNKLTFFREYFKEAFPVFLNSNRFKGVFVCDFFSGAGKDEKGEYGTGLLILDAVKECCKTIRQKKQRYTNYS